MSLANDRQDFRDYLEKSKREPDPRLESTVWDDDPYLRKEDYPRQQSLKKRKKALKRKRGK